VISPARRVRAASTSGAPLIRKLIRYALTLSVGVAVVTLAGPAVSSGASARTAYQIAKELAAVRAQVKGAGSQYDRALNGLERTDGKLRTTDKKIKAESAELAAAESALGERVAAMYRTEDQLGVLSFLLGSTTFEDFITRADLIQIIGDEDAALIRSVKDQRAKLEKTRSELAGQRSVQKADVAAFKRKRDALQGQLNRVQSRYNRLLGELYAAMARERAAGKLTWTPPGPNGMVFPVRGIHYYSNTWGAARSGGRHHKGTDVMAPRGTPLVAVASGMARVHSSGLGGKSVTITADNGWQFYYCHMNGYAIRGGRVSAGQLIGWVGSTGNARGGSPHLHFQMGPGGRWVNPYSYLRSME
jgi:murein DD-endopeptidase MepM/ murein hydrolase activator NlpD